MEENNLPKIGITLGDVNGIGPEVVIKALNQGKINRFCIPILYGSGKHLSKWKNLLGLNDWQFVTIKHAGQAQPKLINLINCWPHEYFELAVGQPTKEAGQLAFESLKRGVEDLKDGHIQAIVTAPINKDTIQSDAFNFPGHTEYLADAFGVKNELMFLVSNTLRVGVVTGHVALSEVKITSEAISSKLESMISSLKTDFGIQKPRIAVLGVNPHAGENGLLGKTELDVITPTIQNFKKKGHLIFGPFPTDGFFGAQQYRQFDAVLAMYHDQGLTPFKMLAFDDGVNFTAGLPVVRTSPDHGTAYGLAGQNQASHDSMLQAIYYAADITNRRQSKAAIEKGALNIQKIKEEISRNSKTTHQ